MDLFVIIIFAVIGWISTIGIKSQFVRLGDILLYGPFLIWFGYTRSENYFEKNILYFMGSTTITYNLRNYLYMYSQKCNDK